MKIFFLQYKKFLIPALIAFLVASFYIIEIPGGLGGDASEYDHLSNSILTGKYSINGMPSMLREPGYPFFRAVLKWLSFSNGGILWIQALLYAATVFLIGLTCFKIDKRTETWGVWGAALSYGLAFYPSHHLSETLTAFLLSIVGLLFITALDNPKQKYWILMGMVSGALLLDRYGFVLIPITCAAVIIAVSLKKEIDKKEIAKNALIFFATVIAIVSPWVIRNYIKFHEANVAGRSGAILYAKAWKVDKSWRALADSYISVFIGRGLLFTVYPNNQSIFQEQWGEWWRAPDKKKLWEDSPTEIDQSRRKAALEIIFKNPNQFARFIAWSGVDGLRSIALPNPIFEAQGSPIEGTYGPLAKEEGLSLVQIAALTSVHMVQLLWFTCIALSVYFGFKKYGFRFIPGIFFIGFILPHLAIDSTARFGAPIEPWLLASIFMVISYPLCLRYCRRLGAFLQS